MKKAVTVINGDRELAQVAKETRNSAIERFKESIDRVHPDNVLVIPLNDLEAAALRLLVAKSPSTTGFMLPALARECRPELAAARYARLWIEEGIQRDLELMQQDAEQERRERIKRQ